MTPPAFAGNHQEREAPPLHRIKTGDGTVDHPCLYGTSHPNYLGRTDSYQSTDPLIKRRNSSETMTYLTLIALMMLVLSPVLIPLVITGAHTIGNLLTA
jgi:hypothetical protein